MGQLNWNVRRCLLHHFSLTHPFHRWHVDQGSTEYYAFGNDPARHTKLSVAKRPDLHHGNDSEHEPVDSMDTNPSGASVGDDSTMTIYAGNEDSPPIGPGGRRSRAR